MLNCDRISSKSKAKPERIPEEGQNEDEDVQMEKARVKEALTCQACEEVTKFQNKNRFRRPNKFKNCWR